MSKQIITPMITLRGKIIFPETVIHFDIMREKSVKAVEQTMEDNQLIFLANQKDMTLENPEGEDLYKVGVIGRVKQLIKLPNNIIRVLVEGLYRAEIKEVVSSKPYFIVESELHEQVPVEEVSKQQEEALIRMIKEVVQEYATQNSKLNRATVKQLLDIQKLELLIDEVATQIPINMENKQQLLEELSIVTRSEKLIITLKEEIEIFHIRKELQGKIKDQVDKNQKDYLLREQLKVIREELGEGSMQEADEFTKKASELIASPEVTEKLIKEIERYKSMPQAASESYVIRNYIETILEMPWDKSSMDKNDIKAAFAILEEDHYGLDKVKERIIEYLAVRTLTNKGQAPIICLVGPPGTGKTSIARSIARAVDKKYVRISLGGIRDEAEIRGHRRTYVGAMPGRIAAGIKQAGVKNPLMLLDEIDKVSKDYKGDTASALLEVLDSEQNINFRDHYLELPLDLSEVLFVATANDLSGVARPLLDRMEIIEVSSYTQNEKFHIAKRYLVTKQIERNGLTKEQINFTDKSLAKIIDSYTREAGVRSLERKIGEICRKAARQILEGQKTSIKVLETSVSKYLGTEIFTKSPEDLLPKVGVVRGLAWTSVGGDTLSIEVSIVPGKGVLNLTGRLGDVMKESAKTGISYVRSVSKKYNIAPTYFDKHDIHIHIPEGAVPKDGPSAGITMATAILSAITGDMVRGDIAMTGEVTLRGYVLPIGGLKEKILAAKMIGVKEVLVPAKNQKNVEDIDKEITNGIVVTYVSTMEEVLSHAIAAKQ